MEVKVLILTWQVVGGGVVGSVVLDERGDRRDVAGVHGWHAGSAANGRSLVVHVQHSAGRGFNKRHEWEQIRVQWSSLRSFLKGHWNNEALISCLIYLLSQEMRRLLCWSCRTAFRLMSNSAAAALHLVNFNVREKRAIKSFRSLLKPDDRHMNLNRRTLRMLIQTAWNHFIYV